jgi:hypothetical protein
MAKRQTWLNRGRFCCSNISYPALGLTVSCAIQQNGIHEWRLVQSTIVTVRLLSKVGRPVINALAFGQQDEKQLFIPHFF